MGYDVLRDAEKYTRVHKRKRFRHRVVTGLASVVVFCTTYALILPAITLEKQCEIPEHTHTDACYALPEETGQEVHTHTDSCYALTRGNLVCGEHVHTDACYTETAVLVCGLEESEEHQHDQSCYETSRELTCGVDSDHTHTDDCYEWERVLSCDLPTDPTDSAKDAQPVLVCGMEEHTHGEECKATEPEEPVFCGKEPHTHGEACRDEQGELTCTLEEHTHSLACYADPTADVETAEIWEQTFGDVTLTGDWRLDALAIAQSQLGYAESTKNYVVAEDGQTLMGYTRYGAWQGDPYGDWNAMFVAFCLHYGGAENIPMDKDCGSWAAALADAFLPAQSHEAAPGDLVFFDRDGDGTADRVAIVAEVTEGGFTAIEGNAEHAVGQRAYEAADSAILGYVVLPQGPKEFTLTARSESGITVTVTGPQESLPCAAQEITLAVTEKVDEESRAVRNALLGEEEAEPERSFLLDITLRRGEEEIEPVGPVTVTFSGIETDGLYPKVYHIDTDTQTVKEMEAEKTGENGDVTVATDHFSWYDLQLLSLQGLSGYIGDKLSNGGEFQLTGDARTEDGGSRANLTITQDTTIDLNGHTLTISKSGQFFQVESGATLTIIDSAGVRDDVSNPGGDVYGHVASLSDDGSTLTYYITTSTPNDTGTTETLEQHTVSLTGAGKILCKEGSYQVIKVETGGTLELLSGVLQGAHVSHIVYVEGGTLNVNGGYIVGGGSDDRPGGGIFVTGGAERGKVNIQDGVVAANRGNFGGGIYVESGELNISGGAVTGNEVFNGHEDNGGGIYVNSGTLNLSGEGYVTNNSKECDCNDCENDVNNKHGGGGIALANGTTMIMSGGYVTGNYSGLAGGGIYAGFYEGDGGVNFTMSGGTIAGNVAARGEGGGLRIGGGTNGVIQATGKVYITNNKTNSDDDWGGGGIFVQENGHLAIMDALIFDNSAEGFGGGVGACPTGKTLIVNQDGAAIYGNTAKGENMSDGGNGKNYDTNLAKASTVFMQNGFTDYFCVRSRDNANDPISLVTGQMAGGGAANWTGSCDEKVVSIGKSGYAAAKYLFGLNAHPDDAAKSQAVNAAKVIITGNYSGVHGGGIMTNGGLILGDPGETKVVTSTPELDITGTKALLKDNLPQNSGLNFQFQLKNEAGAVVGTATANDATGEFTIQDIEFHQAGTYTYTLSEVNDGRTGITYDETVHRIQVTIEEKTVNLLGVTFNSYYVSSVTVNGSESGGSSGSGSGTGPQTGKFRVRYQNTNGWDKVNVYVWDANGEKAGHWPGAAMTQDTDGTWYYDLTVTGKGSYNYIFSKNGSSQTSDIVNILYAPGGEAVFNANGGVISNTADTGSTETGGVSRGANPDGSYTLVMDAPTFKNFTTTQLNLQITKTDSVDAEKLLEGAKFTLQEQSAETALEATTGKDGIALFKGIQRNTTYYLRETQAPSGYMTAGPWILEVRSEDATLYLATENPEGTLVKSGEEGTPLTVTGTDPKVLPVTLRDISWGYELPDTGGAGTTSYTAGGLTLIFGAATLLYIHCKRRKEDEVSS